jgi:hypothetical protein
MKSPSLDLSRFQVVKGNRGSLRGEMLDSFRRYLNPDRRASGYGELSHPRLAQIVQHIETDDLVAFLKQCQTAKCGFSKCFWGSLKTKK